MPSLPYNWIGLIGGPAILIAVAWLADWLTLRVLHGAIRRASARTKSTWDDRILGQGVFTRLAHAVPAVIIFFGIAPALGVSLADVTSATDTIAFAVGITRRVTLAFIVLTATMAMSAFLDAINGIYNESYSQAKSRPIKGYLQIIGLVLYIAASVVVVSILADRSPVGFLSGLGALTAVLMLVFRDTILTFVASLQIMSNDMIRIGDWVEMPQANADGDIIDLALHTVKIQNWDKTISTIPTSKFISESFKNWRGMSESGGRRIKRSLHIDISSIRFCDDAMLERLAQLHYMADYLEEKRKELDAWTAEHEGEPATSLHPRRLTNIGTFRAYVVAYLRHHPKIHLGLTFLVRQLAPTEHGLPLQIYVFSSDQDWVAYEGIQADIFDHLLAVVSQFDLRIYQRIGNSGALVQERAPQSAVR